MIKIETPSSATIPNVLVWKGGITVATDFPTLAAVQTGWVYTILANVTDNNAGKTNTGQSFVAGDEIVWNGTNWTNIGGVLSGYVTSPLSTSTATNLTGFIKGNGSVLSADNSTYLTAEVDPTIVAQTNGFTITRGTTPATLTVAASGSVSGTNTGDGAANSSSTYIGTTQVALNRTSGALSLTGVNIDGSAGTATSATSAGKSTNLVGGNNTTQLGSIPYQSNTDTTLLINNTTTTKKFLRETGDGTNGGVPAFDTVTKTDVGLSNVDNTSDASKNIGGSSATCTGNAGTVTNGVYTTGNQSIAGIKTLSDATEASNATTGGTIVSGGLAVAKRVYATDMTVTNKITGSISGNCDGSAGTATTAGNLSGTPALPNGTTAHTYSQSDNSTNIATTAYVDTGLGTKAPLASPTFTTSVGLTSGDITASNGNFVAGTAGKGLNLVANHSANSYSNNVLTTYEEGTWTPVITGFTLVGGSTSTVGYYTKIGNHVYIQGAVVISGGGTIASIGGTTSYITGLPFTAKTVTGGFLVNFFNPYNFANLGYCEVAATTNTLYAPTFSAQSANQGFCFSGSYLASS